MSVVSSNGIPLENRVFALDMCQLSSYMKRHCKLRWQFPDVPGPITTIYKYVEIVCNSFHSKQYQNTQERGAKAKLDETGDRLEIFPRKLLTQRA